LLAYVQYKLNTGKVVPEGREYQIEIMPRFINIVYTDKLVENMLAMILGTLFDEITNYDPEEVAELAYKISEKKPITLSYIADKVEKAVKQAVKEFVDTQVVDRVLDYLIRYHWIGGKQVIERNIEELKEGKRIEQKQLRLLKEKLSTISPRLAAEFSRTIRKKPENLTEKDLRLLILSKHLLYPGKKAYEIAGNKYNISETVKDWLFTDKFLKTEIFPNYDEFVDYIGRILPKIKSLLESRKYRDLVNYVMQGSLTNHVITY